LDQKIRSRFDELIEEGNELISKMVAHNKEFKARTRNDGVMYVSGVYGHASEYQALVFKTESMGIIYPDTLMAVQS